MNNDTTATAISQSASHNSETLMNSTVQTELCDIVESRIAAGERVTILHLAKEKNISPTEVRNALVEHFGNRIQFKRGRTGGIVLT